MGILRIDASALEDAATWYWWLGVFAAVAFAIGPGTMLTQTVQAGTGESLFGGAFAFGLLGLAAMGDAGNEIDRLTRKIERFVERDGDVDFSTEHDGEIGRLYDAVDELAATAREHERYRAFTDDVLNAVDDVFYVLDRDGAFREWNTTLCEVTGYSDEAVGTMHATDFFAADDRETVANAIEEVFETGEARVEAKYLTREGTQIPFEFVAVAIEDPAGELLLAGIGRDVSDRMAYERQLRERERQLTTLISNIPGMVYRCQNAPDWPFEFVSEGCRELTGYEPESLESGDVNWSEDVVLEGQDELWDRVQRSLSEKVPFQVTFPIETAGGDRRWVREQGRGVYTDDGTLEALEGVIIDVTERVERERELERTRSLLDQTQRLARVGGFEIDVADGPPFEITATDELERIYDVEVEEAFDLETALDVYHPDDRSHLMDVFERVVAHGETETSDARLVTATGTERWVKAIGRPIHRDGEIVSVVGALQDITDRKEYELALHSLHEATSGLLSTETETDVAELVVNAAMAVLDVPGIALYVLDQSSNELAPVSATGSFVVGGDPPAVPVGERESALWDAYLTGTQTLVDEPNVADHGSPFDRLVDGGVLVPIGDHGVFAVAAPEAGVDDETRQLIETLVATTEAAFDRIESEAILRAQDETLQTQNRRLERQVAINEIIRTVDQSLIGATSQSEIERTVCERLVANEGIAFAWIGGVEGRGTDLVPRVWAGAGQSYLDSISLDVQDAASEPAVRTALSEQSTVVPNVVEGLKTEPWRRHALTCGFTSCLSVPLTFDEYTYGILAVYADESGTFGDLELRVFEELGESIANAINAVTARQALDADTVTELTLQFVDSDAFLARVARDVGCEVEYGGMTTHSADSTHLFFSTSGASPTDVQGVLDALVTVTDHRLISTTEGQCLFEATVSGPLLPSLLVRHGASLRSLRATATEMELVIDVPVTTDVRRFVEMVDDHYPTAELVGRRDVERTMHTRRELVTSLLDELTDRQLEVLKTAYFAGFFEWPRESTGEEIAEMLDISQPTVNRHLRLGQQRLLARLLDSEPTVGG